MELEDLPKDLVTIEIAGKLTIRSLERLGLASKGWNAWLKSLQLPSLAPWCVVMQKFYLNDRNKAWYSPNGRELPEVFHLNEKPGMISRVVPAVFDLNENTWHEWDLRGDIVASCKDYLLLEDEKDFILINLYKNSDERRVPKLEWNTYNSHIPFSVSLLIEDTEEITHDLNFKIVIQPALVMLGKRELQNLSVFDSRKKFWDDSPKFEPVFTLRVGLDVQVYDSLYRMDTCIHDDKYMIYRLQTSKEECEEGRNQISVPDFPGSIQEYPESLTIYLLDHEGMPMIFGRVWNDIDGKWNSDVIIWQMEIEANCFVEIMRVPNKAILEFYPEFDFPDSIPYAINFRTHGDYFYLLEYCSSKKILICNLKEKVYYIENIPEVISKNQLFMNFHLFDPRLKRP